MKIQSLPQKIVSFLKEVRVELKKVNWPTRNETIKLTLIVIIVTAGVAAFLGGLDFVFNQLIQTLIK